MIHQAKPFRLTVSWRRLASIPIVLSFFEIPLSSFSRDNALLWMMFTLDSIHSVNQDVLARYVFQQVCVN